MALTKVHNRMIAGAAINVKDFGAVGDGSTDDTAAIQAAVDDAISSGVKAIFFPFGQRERYRLTSTIVIESSGFGLRGDATPVYNPDEGGYVFADSGVVDLFNYGNDATGFASNQFVCDGMAFYSSQSPFTQTAIKHAQNNNGPHRGTLLRDTCAKGFVNVMSFDVATGSNLSAASVVVENCVFRGNTNAVNAVERALGLLYVGNQSEAGARITGFWGAGVTIEANMLEGQSNPIDISANAPSVRIENNYFEACSGDFHVGFSGTNPGAAFDVRPNYVTNPLSTDIVRIEGTCRVTEKTQFSVNPPRKTPITLLGAAIRPGTDIYGDFYTGTTSPEYAFGFTNPVSVQPPSSSAVTDVTLGAVALSTPFGKTTTGITVNGFPATYYTLTKSYSAGDVLVACALVRVEDVSPAEEPYFLIYNDAFASTSVSCSQLDMLGADGGKWYLMFAARASSVAGTEAKFRFGSNGTSAGTSNLYVAAIGVDVVPAADFETFNSVDRAFVRLFNPYL